MNTVGTFIQNFQYFFYILRTYFLHLYIYLSNIANNKQLEIKYPSFNDENEYLKKRTNDFKTLSRNNRNINPIFYNKSVYDDYMNEENETKLEQQWKLRILFEYTPRGNIYMFYDPYKMGFKYYSDQKTISYEILNACAMKYVKLFECYDFFMDEYHLINKNNPLIKLHYSIEQPVKKYKKTREINGPFIKRNVNTENTTQKPIENEKNKNKFLYLGKLSNTNFLNIPKKNKNSVLFKSTLLDGLVQNSKVQDQRLSYKDFKNTQKQQQQDKSEIKETEVLTIEGSLNFFQD
jgi:hypothetical protein